MTMRALMVGLLLAGPFLTGCDPAAEEPAKPVGAPFRAEAQRGVAAGPNFSKIDQAAVYRTASDQADHYQRQAGRIALERSRSPRIKSLARLLAEDHEASIKAVAAAPPHESLTAELASHNERIALANQTDRFAGWIDALQTVRQADFDRTFLHQQRTAHAEILLLQSLYAEGGDTASLKTLATQAVVREREHFKHLSALAED